MPSDGPYIAAPPDAHPFEVWRKWYSPEVIAHPDFFGLEDINPERLRRLFEASGSGDPIAQRFHVAWCYFMTDQLGRAIQRQPSLFNGGEDDEWDVTDDLLLLATTAIEEGHHD
jgi:hypothetical protein